MTDQPASSPPPTLHVAAAAPASSPRPYKFRGEGTGPLQRLSWVGGRLISRILSVLIFKLHAVGQARLPAKGPVLMVTNHQSFLDPWLIGIAIHRQLHYMARDSLFKGGFLQFLGELWNAFPVKRGAADLGAIRTAVERLDKGFIVSVFPEGTRSEDGTIGAIAPGITLILNRCKADVPIMPVVIDGAFEAWPRKRKLPQFFGAHPIRIEYGPPIPASEWRKHSADELAVRIRRELINLQRALGSPHAEASQRRLDVELANPVLKPARRRG